MKKIICIMLSTVLLMCALAGCNAKKDSAFMTDNEIFTYQRVDPEKTQIVVSRTGNIPVEQICTAFEALNPDIQVIYLDITGGNSRYIPLTEWIVNGDLPDIVVSSAMFFNAELTVEYFENLSAAPFVQNFEAAALQRGATDANIYWLPGPSDISAMMYNKTLFERYGWEVPATFDEFVALCDRIREDTNGETEPWNPNAKYGNELITAIEAFTYEEILGGLENRTWYDDFIAGEATFAGHMEPYTDVLETLIEHDILREEHFTYSATARGKEFGEGKIAMLNGNIFSPNSDEFEFSLMPFPTTKGDVGYLCDSYSYYVGVPIKERSEKQEAAVERFLTYFSTPEGQQACIGNTMKISNIKGVEINRSDELAALQEAVEAGHLFGLMDFQSKDATHGSVELHTIAQNMALNGMSGDECIAAVDERRSAAPGTVQEEAPEVLAVAETDMSVLETSFLIADLYRDTAGADIGLITHNEAYCGNLMRIYAGDITPDRVTVLKPRSFANDSTLVKLTMTGQQIMDALNAPVGNNKTADCIYAYSGLKCTVAPWNALGEKYLSLKLEDGAKIEPDKLYTVAAWAGTVADEYITETTEAYEGTWEELMTAWLRAQGRISPVDDGRIKLVWD